MQSENGRILVLIVRAITDLNLFLLDGGYVMGALFKVDPPRLSLWLDI